MKLFRLKLGSGCNPDCYFVNDLSTVYILYEDGNGNYTINWNDGRHWTTSTFTNLTPFKELRHYEVIYEAPEETDNASR